MPGQGPAAARFLGEAPLSRVGVPSRPSADAVLLIVPAGMDGQHPAAAGTMVCGIPLLRRIVVAGVRAGFGQILVRARGKEDGSVLDGTPATLLAPGSVPPVPRPGRLVLVAENVLPHPRWLVALLALPVERDRLYVDGSSAAVIEATDPGRLLSAAALSRSVEDLLVTAGAAYGTESRAFDPSGRVIVATSEDLERAEEWLLRSLIKANEGFMSRHVERRISLALTRRLVTTRITPNAVTLVSLLIGLAGAPFFLSSAPAYQLVGALLFVAHSIVDGCDGELARLRFQESRAGALLDFWGDNVVHVAVFGSMAIGWSWSVHAAWPLALGAAAVLGTVLSAAGESRRWLEPAGLEAESSRLARVRDSVANRDFIYLVVLLAAVGKAAWFVVLVAVGTPIFLALLIWVARHPDGSRRP